MGAADKSKVQKIIDDIAKRLGDSANATVVTKTRADLAEFFQNQPPVFSTILVKRGNENPKGFEKPYQTRSELRIDVEFIVADPAGPEERLEDIIKDIRRVMLNDLTYGNNAAPIPAEAGVTIDYPEGEEGEYIPAIFGTVAFDIEYDYTPTDI